MVTHAVVCIKKQAALPIFLWLKVDKLMHAYRYVHRAKYTATEETVFLTNVGNTILKWSDNMAQMQSFQFSIGDSLQQAMWLDTQMALLWTRNDLWHTPECVGWLQALGHITLLLFLSFKESFLQHWLRCQTQSEPKIHLTVRHSSCFLWPAVVKCQPKNYLSKKDLLCTVPWQLWIYISECTFYGCALLATIKM